MSKQYISEEKAKIIMSSEQQEWQFHFRSFYQQGNMHVRVHHAGCAETPWHDGRPGCWRYDIPYSPTGGVGAVYRPSNWVTHFGDWWNVIKDGLKLIVHLGVLIVVPEPKVDDVIDVISDVFAIPKDIVKNHINDMSPAELDQMLQTCYQSVDEACKKNGMNPDVIKQMAKDMNLQTGKWGILAGQTYRDYIWNSNSPLNNGKGWSVFRGYGPKTADSLLIAEACFIDNGHLIIPVDGGDHPKYGDTFWKFWSSNFDG